MTARSAPDRRSRGLKHGGRQVAPAIGERPTFEDNQTLFEGPPEHFTHCRDALGCGDLGEVQVHRLGVAGRHHQGCTLALPGAGVRAASGNGDSRCCRPAHFAIDPDKVEDDKKFDGIFVLRTNTDLNPLEAMLCYKQLWTVEQTFRTAKHLLSTRPIFHKLDATIRGHVFCSFLALVLKKALEDRIAALARSGSWPQIIADLDSLTETEIEHDGKRFVVRSAPRPAASLALRAAGVALPPTVREAAAR